MQGAGRTRNLVPKHLDTTEQHHLFIVIYPNPSSLWTCRHSDRKFNGWLSMSWSFPLVRKSLTEHATTSRTSSSTIKLIIFPQGSRQLQRAGAACEYLRALECACSPADYLLVWPVVVKWDRTSQDMIASEAVTTARPRSERLVHNLAQFSFPLNCGKSRDMHPGTPSLSRSFRFCKPSSSNETFRRYSGR